MDIGVGVGGESAASPFLLREFESSVDKGQRNGMVRCLLQDPLYVPTERQGSEGREQGQAKRKGSGSPESVSDCTTVIRHSPSLGP